MLQALAGVQSRVERASAPRGRGSLVCGEWEFVASFPGASGAEDLLIRRCLIPSQAPEPFSSVLSSPDFRVFCGAAAAAAAALLDS